MALHRRDAEGLDLLVLNAINKCWKVPIHQHTLLSILQGQEEPGMWIGHLGLFFTELPLEAMVRFMHRHHLSRDQVAAAYFRYSRISGDRNPGLEAWLGE